MDARDRRADVERDIARRDCLPSAETLLACGAGRRAELGGRRGFGADESFAGQLDSILHVDERCGARARRCSIAGRRSGRSERCSIASATQVPSNGMGVVVQQQVDARAAGVLFTDDGDGTMLVEFAPGLADALVPARSIRRACDRSRDG